MNAVSDPLDQFHDHMVLLTQYKELSSAWTDTWLEGQLVKSLLSHIKEVLK